MLRHTRIIGLAVLVLAAGGASERSSDPWEQSWMLSHLELADGSVHSDTTPQGAHLDFRPAFQGGDGCDLFAGQFQFADPQLEFSDIEYSYTESHPVPAACPNEGLLIRDAMRSALDEGVVVTTLTSELMVWHWEAGGITFEFHPGVEG